MSKHNKEPQRKKQKPCISNHIRRSRPTLLRSWPKSQCLERDLASRCRYLRYLCIKLRCYFSLSRSPHLNNYAHEVTQHKLEDLVWHPKFGLFECHLYDRYRSSYCLMLRIYCSDISFMLPSKVISMISTRLWSNTKPFYTATTMCPWRYISVRQERPNKEVTRYHLYPIEALSIR